MMYNICYDYLLQLNYYYFIVFILSNIFLIIIFFLHPRQEYCTYNFIFVMHLILYLFIIFKLVLKVFRYMFIFSD